MGFSLVNPAVSLQRAHSSQSAATPCAGTRSARDWCGLVREDLARENAPPWSRPPSEFNRYDPALRAWPALSQECSFPAHAHLLASGPHLLHSSALTWR